MSSYNDPEEGKIYISPSIKDMPFDRKIRIISKLINSSESYAFAKVKDEIVLRHTHGGNKEIRAKFIEDSRKIIVLSIQGYTVATQKPYNASFSFIGEEIDMLYNFIDQIRSIKLNNAGYMELSEKDLNSNIITNREAMRLVQSNPELFMKILRTEVASEDIIAIGYRKKQLNVFQKLIDDKKYFEDLKAKKKCKSESLWQQYFEKNTWIFGYGLGYIFLTGLDNKKLEQVIHGYNVNDHGKRVDALMKTKGIISNLCFIEIKTHFTPLLESTPYRSGCWSPSKDLSGAVAQIQGTVASAMNELSNKISIKDNLGNPTGEEIFNYQPKSYLVIGSLNEFTSDNGVNEQQLRSFELYRKNIINPEIITFDELYERAKFIVHHNESEV